MDDSQVAKVISGLPRAAIKALDKEVAWLASSNHDYSIAFALFAATRRAESSLQDLCDERAAKLVSFQMEFVIGYVGGHMGYIKKCKRFTLKDRNKLIVSDFNGRNIPELSKRWNLTESRIRQILDAERRTRMDKAPS